MKQIIILSFMLFGAYTLQAQTKNFIDQPFLETEVEVDTLVTPNKIFLKIILSEEDHRNRTSTEAMEKTMINTLQNLQIDVENNLTLLDFNSDYKKLLLSGTKIMKIKHYVLWVKNAQTAADVLVALENAHISNVWIDHAEYTPHDELLLQLRRKAVLKAKKVAETMVAPLNQTVGKAIYISDQKTTQTAYRNEAAGLSIRGASSIHSAVEDMTIEFDKIKFSVNVHIKFMIE